MITRTWKNSQHDIYNSFAENTNESIVWSDDNTFVPDSRFSFKRDMKDDFIV